MRNKHSQYSDKHAPGAIRGNYISMSIHTRRSMFHVGRLIFSRFTAGLMLFAATANSAAGEPAIESTKSRPATKLATVQEMVDALTDLWGDAAMRDANGASYEFFKD